MPAKLQLVKLLEEIEFLYEKYSDEPRATTQPYYLRKVEHRVERYQYHPDDVLVRESLLEHIEPLVTDGGHSILSLYCRRER